MKYLTLIRHAKSSWDNPALADIDRPLNARGKRAIGLTGNLLRQKGLHPDLVLSSPAVRARSTAEGIAAALGITKKYIRLEPVIYTGGVPELLELISGFDNSCSDVFLFGHEPVLSGLIVKLGGPALEKFPTCAVYRFAFHSENWKALRTTKGDCEFYVFPKMVSGQ